MERNLRRSPSRLAALSEMKRNRSPGRPKSPARKKSPARTKSPARKSPARKSPSRKTSKSPSRKKAPAVKNIISEAIVSLDRYSPSPRREVLKISPDIEDKSGIQPVTEDLVDIRNSRSRERSRTVEEIRLSSTRTLISGSNYSVESSSGGITRRSARIKSSSEKLDGFKKDIEEEVQKILKSNHVTSSDYITRPAAPQEFGGIFGALFLILFLPTFVLALQLSCVNKDKCKLFDFLVSTNWKFYLDPYASAWFTGFVIWQILLSVIPLHKKVDGLPPKNDSLEYRCSGIVNALLSLCVIGALQYFKYPVTIIVSKTVPLLITSIIFGFLVSLALFIKGGRPGVIEINYGKNDSKIYAFWAGREINPRFGFFDVKQTLIRIAVVGALIYNTAVILRATDNKHWSSYPPTILLLVGLQMFTLFDFLVFEEKFLSSFLMQHEGTGYMVVTGCFVFPFFVTIISKFLLLNSIELNVYYLVAFAVLYFFAYLIYRLSSNQKSNFRRNPLNPSLTHLENLPTIIPGKKLLCGGWWGIVRHPNYLGLILMYWTLASSAGIVHVAPYAVALASTVILVHRAIRVSERCKALYSNSWDRYTQKVKNYLVPRVF